MGGHLEDAAHVRRLVAVEEVVSLGGIRVDVGFTLQKAKRHERIQKIPCRARMQPKASTQSVKRLGSFCQLGEKAHFHCT